MEIQSTNIPKIIHYVWVGPAPFPTVVTRCIASWKKFLPEYTFRFWHEGNAPMDHPYVVAMYQKKKWAFVSDYIRFWALAREGGIYLDTDTEVLKSFNDLLMHEAFFGQTKDGMTAAGVIGAIPQHPAIIAMLNEYDQSVTRDTMRTSPMVVTDVLKRCDGTHLKVFDYRYFNPCDDGETCTIDKLALAYTNNHWAESWVSFARVRKFLRRIGVMPMLKFFFK